MAVANPPQIRREQEATPPEVEVETQVEWLRHAGGPRRSGRQDFAILTGSILTVLFLVAAGTLYWLEGRLDAIQQEIPELTAVADPNIATNWLLVGTDSRDGISEDDTNAATMIGGDEDYSGKRTDTIMVARVDRNAGEINLVSIPRDLWVPIAGTAREGRINSAFVGEGGDARLIRTVESVLDIEIHHYAEINFVGFQDLVDDVGGLPLWFDRALRDHNSGLDIPSPGCFTLDGSQALAFARSRQLEYYDGQAWRLDGTGDLGRMNRQRFVVRHAVDLAGSKIEITSMDTVLKLISTAGDNLIIDDSLSPQSLVEFGRIFQQVNGEQIQTHVLPTTSYRTEGGSSVLGLLEVEARNEMAIFRGEDPVEIAPEEATVRLLISNGSRVSGQANAVKTVLSGIGFDILDTVNSETTELTRIEYGFGMEEGVDRVARLLSVTPEFAPDPEAREIKLVTGKNFGGILAEPLPEDTFNVPVVALAPGQAPPVVAPTVEATAAATVQAGILPGPPPPGTTCE